MTIEHDDYVYPGKRFTRCGHVSGEGQGMSFRDAAALAAMQGQIAGYMANPDMSGLSPSMIAREAYEFADAMLAARKDRPHD